MNTSNFMSRPFFKPDWHNFFISATFPLQSRVPRLKRELYGRDLPGLHKTSFLRSSSPWSFTTERDCETAQTSNDCGELSNGVAVRNMMPDTMKLFMTLSLKIGAILHSFVHTLLWCIDITSFRLFKVMVLVFVCSPSGSTERHQPRRLTAGQLLYLSDCRGTIRAT